MNAPVLEVTRTPGEIVEQVRKVIASGGDIFGVHVTDLLEALDFEHAREFLVPGATPEAWAESISKPPSQWAREYVPFALGKIRDHRGLSAARSIDHFTAWAWLFGWDLPREPWGQYGAAVVYAYLERFGWLDLWPSDDEQLERMRRGDLCRPYCGEGCGS